MEGLDPRAVGDNEEGENIANLSASQATITIKLGDSIQDAIDKLNVLGGGNVFLRNGTHTPPSDLTLYSNIYMEGENAELAIIDFQSGAFGIKVEGSNAYTTGTVAVTNNSQTVTGSGTTFTSAMLGRNILLSGIWYPIVAFGSTTSITIGLPFGSPTISGESYVIATTINDARLISFTVKGSATAAVKTQYGNRYRMDRLHIQTSAVGLDMDDTAQISIDDVNLIANNIGMTADNCHYVEFEILAFLDTLAGNAMTLNNVSNSAFNNNFILNSAGDGVNITNSSNLTFNGCSVIENAGQGFEFVSGNSDIIIDQSAIENNASDGIKYTATSDDCFVMGSSIKGNGGWGVNVAASTVDNLVITSNNFSSNTSGAVTDSGTGTVIRGNVGVADNSTSGSGSIIKSFIAGESIAINDACYLQSTTGNSIDLESGSSQYLSVVDSASLSVTGDMTIEGWVKPESISTQITIASKWLDTGNQRSWLLAIQPDGDIEFRNSANGSTVGSAVVAAGITTGSWQHIALTYDASAGQIEVFVGGVSQGTATGTLVTSIFDSTSDFNIGLTDDGGGIWYGDGLFSHLRVWNDIRTQPEIDDNKSLSLVGDEAGLQGCWQLNNTLLDETSNNNDLTNNGSAVFADDAPFIEIGEPDAKVFKTDASATATSDSFIGFAKSAISTDATGDLNIGGVQSGFSGLTTASQYYLSDTAGEISSSVGTVTRKVGIAISTTELLITNIW